MVNIANEAGPGAPAAKGDEWFGHPRQLARLFTTEAMERFGYYGMRALLTLYLAQHFLFDDTTTTGLYGGFTALVYLTPLVGGLLADRILGSKRSVKFGAILMSLGYLVLCFSSTGPAAKPFAIIDGQRYEVTETGSGEARQQFVVDKGEQLRIKGNEDKTVSLLRADGSEGRKIAAGGFKPGGERSPLYIFLLITGLALVVIGNGFFKPNISTIVGTLYADGDRRRDAGFTIFYMGINLGAFLSAFMCGTLGEKVGWHWGFGSAAVGMILGLLLYMMGRPVLLKGIGDAPRPGAGAMSAFFLVAALLVSAAFAALYHLGSITALQRAMDQIQQNRLLTIALILVGLAVVLGWTGWFIALNRPEDRGPVFTIFAFMFFNAFFWIAFEQAGSSINVFTEANTDRYIGSFEVPATWFQSVNAGLIFILAPLFAVIWTALGTKNRNPSQPAKIALGLIFLGVGYIFMVWAGKIAVGGSAKAGMWLVFMTYFWHTVGELCLSPTGLSYVTKAAPVKFVSLLMGIWFISSFIANLGGGLVASLVEDVEAGRLSLPWSFGGQADFFFLFVVTSIGAGLVVLVLTPMLKKLMRPGT